MTALVRAWFDAWNAHDGAALAAVMAPDGVYEGPTTPMAVHAYDLPAIVDALAAQVSGFTFEVGAVTGPAGDGDGRFAAEWTLRGVNDGPIKTGVAPTGRALHVPGVDLIEVAGGTIVSVRRLYDRRGMMEQLGLQVLVEPYRQGSATYGYSLHASSGNPSRPGVIALTWIEARDKAERDRVRAHSSAIVAGFLTSPGFIGIVTGFAGERGFTCTAWEDEASLHAALDREHARAKQDFRTSGLSPGVWTSVWTPHRLNRLWRRCTTCGQPNDMTEAPKACAVCGADLPPRPPYW